MIAAILAGLARYKIGLEIITFGLLALGAVYGAHQFLEHERDIGRQEVQARWDAQLAIDKAAAREKEAAFAKQLQEATKNASDRDQTIRTLAAASGGANLGLRDTLTAISRGVPSATVDALGKSVTTLSTVLAECSGRYQGLAEKADRHASDVRTLQEAWPKSPQQPHGAAK